MTAAVIILGIFTVMVLDEAPLELPKDKPSCEVNVECTCNGDSDTGS